MAEDDIKVSIVIPAYYVGQYIKPCIDSPMNQKHHNIEKYQHDQSYKDNFRFTENIKTNAEGIKTGVEAGKSTIRIFYNHSF